jgi:DNA-3-methyladenine glycosylase II
VRDITIAPDGAFSLAAAAAFGFGPNTGRPKPDGNSMSLAFVADDLRHHAAAVVTQDPDGVLHARLIGEADPTLVEAQVRRVLSLDHSGLAWEEVGTRDPVIARLQASHAGLRPVLFHSPYEAAAWSVLSQRRHRVQATVLRRRLSAGHGRVFRLPTGDLEAFPLPEALLRVESFPSIEPVRMDRLHAVARAALDGDLEPSRLLGMSTEEALTDLCRLPGIGPMYAGLILLRSSGATDVMTFNEPHLPAYVAHFYGLPVPASPAELERIAAPWRPFRTWTSVLIRVAGDLEGTLRGRAAAAQTGGGR